MTQACAASSSNNSSQWVISIIEKKLKRLEDDADATRNPKCSIFRIPRKVKDDDGVAPYVYTPEFLSLGLYHRSEPHDYVPYPSGENCKHEMVAAFLKIVGQENVSRLGTGPSRLNEIEGHQSNGNVDNVNFSIPTRFTDLCNRVAGELESSQLVEHCQCYDLQDQNPVKDHESAQSLQIALTLDAICVTTHLMVISNSPGGDRLKDLFSLVQDHWEQNHSKQRNEDTVVLDILKQENQIPLHLLRNVMRVLYSQNPAQGEEEADGALNSMCVGFVRYISKSLPGYHDILVKRIEQMDEQKVFLKCDHLLACVSRVLCPEGDEIEATPPGRKGYTTPDWVPSASRLQQAGIKIRVRSKGPWDILPEFKRGWPKATLYIPKMKVDALTPFLWKNLLAYEHRTLHMQQKKSQLLAFLNFMNDLIKSQEDVLLMTRGVASHRVLDHTFTTNEPLVSLFNEITVGYPVPKYFEWVVLAQQLNDYYHQNHRRLVLDFLTTNFGKPWVAISVLGALLLLTATILQTCYTIVGFYNNQNTLN